MGVDAVGVDKVGVDENGKLTQGVTLLCWTWSETLKTGFVMIRLIFQIMFSTVSYPSRYSLQ